MNNFLHFPKLRLYVGVNEPEPVSIKVDNCNDEYCAVKRGVPAHMEMTFAPKTESDNLKASANAKFAGMWMPWSLEKQANVCNYLSNGVKCPIKAQQKATYYLDFKIPSIAPVGTQTAVQLRIVDSAKSVVACTSFPVTVVA